MKSKPVKSSARRPLGPGIDVDPQAVRQARLDAGLSLAEVANGQLTRAAIHLIETGRSRPSARTLELIARRTGKPTSFFRKAKPSPADTEPQAPKSRASNHRTNVEELARLAMSSNQRIVIEAARKLLATSHDERSEAHIRYYLGRAQVQLSEPAAALEHLRRAGVLFNQLNDPWMIVECMDWEAGALYLLERPEALQLSTDALVRCRQLSPIPVSTEVRILGHLAAVHTLQHQWKEAISRYEEAIERAGAIRDLSRLGKMYNDLSLAYQQMGALGKAAAYLHKAVAVHEMLDNRTEIAFAENNLALVLMEQGQLESAERHLKTSLAMFDELNLQQRRSHAVLSLAELNIARGGFSTAEQLAEEALALATQHQERMTAALAHQVLGQLADRRQDRTKTDEEFSAAIGILHELNVPQRSIECLSKFAQILEERGDTSQALQHLKAAVALAAPRASSPAQTRSRLQA